MRIEYVEQQIETVFAFYIDNFKIPPGQRVKSSETTYDPHTGKVIFKLYIDDKPSGIEPKLIGT